MQTFSFLFILFLLCSCKQQDADKTHFMLADFGNKETGHFYQSALMLKNKTFFTPE